VLSGSIRPQGVTRKGTWFENVPPPARLSAPIRICPASLKKQHSKALRLSGAREFVLYSLRHTFLTRLGESGCDAWTLARIAGHSSIVISSRYVHPGEDAVLAATSGLCGHRIGHREEMPVVTDDASKQLTH
jgi:integrase